MKTEYYKVKYDFSLALENAYNHIKNGSIIIFPTETVYGIGCRLFDEFAIKKIYEIKQRPKDKPLTAYITRIDMLNVLCKNIPDEFLILAEKFLPGPLTIILHKKNEISTTITSGLDTIGIRMTNNKFCQELITLLDEPLAGTSANISGKTSISDISPFCDEFEGKVSSIYDDGPCNIGTESTVLNLTGKEPEIIRQGAISKNDIEIVLQRKIKS